MKKAILVISSFVMIIIMSSAFMTDDGPKYKNLKILSKNITKEELDSVMHHFALSLGQKCNFCHVRNEQDKTWDFESDAVPDKLIARKMMLMAAKINKQNFAIEEQNKKVVLQAVTCYTCHHGQPIPEKKPPLPPRRDSVRTQAPIVDSLKVKDSLKLKDSLRNK
jgi:hypothetical protein